MNFLVSHAYLRKSKQLLSEAMRVAKGGHTILVDSGAFTAHFSGNPISLSEYIKAYHECYKHFAESCIGLDVINDPKRTLENIAEMHRQGCDVQGVLTSTAPVTDAIRMIELSPRICIAGGGTNQSNPWFHHRVHKVCSMGGLPHGLAATGEMGARLPFYSVDSSSYTMGKRFARSGKWEFQTPQKLSKLLQTDKEFRDIVARKLSGVNIADKTLYTGNLGIHSFIGMLIEHEKLKTFARAGVRLYFAVSAPGDIALLEKIGNGCSYNKFKGEEK